VENSIEQNKNDLLVIFMHIQKTGGTTLINIMQKQYPPDEVLAWHHKRKKNISNELKSKLKCVHHAHVPFGVHSFYPDRQFTYITMFRDPVERVLSQYYFIQELKDHPLHKRVKGMSLEQFLDDHYHRSFRLTRNYQTQMVSGSMNPKKANLKKAKKNIKSYFAVVGITEMFNESLFLIKKTLGWDNLSYLKENITHNRPTREQIPRHIIKKIKKLNQLDIELYNWVKANLESTLKKLNPHDQIEMKEFIKNLTSQ
jgi:hypothetical protein